jgi:lysophospholipase L1-like esterase
MRNIYAVVCSVLLALACCGANAQPAPLRVVFFGNSFTYWRNLPGMVASFAAADGIGLQISESTKGDASLDLLWRIHPTPQLLAEKWNYVVLQENPQIALYAPDRFLDAARKFDEAAKKAGAKTILLTVIPRAASTKRPLHEATLKVASELGALMAPAGAAYMLTADADPKLNLHDIDGLHPNALGTYLMACSVYLAISAKESCPELELTAINKQDAATLRTAAQRASAEVRAQGGK